MKSLQALGIPKGDALVAIAEREGDNKIEIALRQAQGKLSTQAKRLISLRHRRNKIE